MQRGEAGGIGEESVCAVETYLAIGLRRCLYLALVILAISILMVPVRVVRVVCFACRGLAADSFRTDAKPVDAPPGLRRLARLSRMSIPVDARVQCRGGASAPDGVVRLVGYRRSGRG